MYTVLAILVSFGLSWIMMIMIEYTIKQKPKSADIGDVAN